MLIRIRGSKDLLLQFQSFECSSLFASNSCVYCTTRYNKCGRIGTKWLFFFTFIEECCIVIEKNIDKKFSNRISYQICYKRCLKGKFGRGGSKSAKGGPYSYTFRINKINFTNGEKKKERPNFYEVFSQNLPISTAFIAILKMELPQCNAIGVRTPPGVGVYIRR